MRFILIILIIELLTIIKTCKEGCLRCNSESEKCELCDGLNLYHRQNGECIKLEIPNCLFISEKRGNCLKCSEDFYLLNDICVAKTTDMIYNCLIYFGSTICKKAKIGSPAYDIIFDATFVTIDNCLQNDSKSTCKKCKEGYAISHDKKSCKQLSALSDENCLIFTKIECSACKENFYFNKNNYADKIKLFKEDTETDGFLTNLLNMFENRQQTALEDCVENTDINCSIFESMIECKKCNDGYFVNKKKKCEKIPIPMIKNCEDYDQYLNCVNCFNKFLLKTPLECVPVDEIANCEIYNSKIKISECIKCIDKFYLNNNICIDRTKTVENCVVYNPTKDECEKCKEGFKISSNFLSCLKSENNCKSDVEENNIFRCTQCIEQYLLTTNNTCQKGNIEHCRIYNSTNCVECMRGYVLANNLCVPRTNIQVEKFCKNIDAENPNRCLTCEDLSDAFDIIKPCVENDFPIENCSSYSEQNQCLLCDDGYDLVNNECQLLIPDENFCLKKNSNGVDCDKCKKGFFVKNGKCQGYSKYEYQNCLDFTETDGHIDCNQCDTKSTFSELDGYIGICDFSFNSTHIGDVKSCLLYDIEDNTKCKKCDRDLILIEENNKTSCRYPSFCPHQILTERLEIDAKGYVNVKKYNECVNLLNVSNCGVYTVNYKISNNPIQDSEYVCSKCKNNYYPLLINTEGKAHINDEITKSTDFNNRIYAIKQCVDKETVEATLFITNENLENCEILLKDFSEIHQQDYYTCYKCKFGFSGKLKILDNKYYISNCSPINNCVNDKIFTGLGSLPNQLFENQFPSVPFSTFLNCHSCLLSEQTPFFAIADKSETIVNDLKTLNFELYDLIGFDYNEDPPMKKAELRENSMNFNFCINSNIIKSFDTSNYFPTNCGAGLMLLNKVKSNYNGINTSVLCIACKPGYRATMFSEVPYAVDNCFKIDYCKTSNRFNGCSQCEIGYVLKYDEINKKPILNECIKSKVDNCLYASEMDKCNICKNGYILHLNKSCFLIDVENCNSNTSLKLINLKVLTLPQEIGLLVHERRSGLPFCSVCSQGYNQVELFFEKKKVCMRNPNLFLKEGLKADINSIEHCNLYLNTEQVKCKECKNNFVISEDNLICFEEINLANCSVAINNTNCKTCKPGYYLNQITKNCIDGEIWGCKTFFNENECSECFDGYIYEPTKKRCFFLPEVNCEQFSLSGNQLTCTKCKSFFFKFETTNSYRYCLPYNLFIKNCIKYENNTINCEQCHNDYYLDTINNICLKRTQINNCLEYKTKEDVCEICNKGYRLVDGMSCEPNPTGIKNCKIYEDVEICKFCDKNYYYFEGKCLVVQPAEIIPNCNFYSKNNEEMICEECDEDYFLEQAKVCVETNIKNCKIFESVTKCLECKAGSSLIEENDLLTCKQIKIENCKEINSSNHCIKCEVGYYPDFKGKCKHVETIIAGCEEYLDEKTCLKCTNDKILSKNKKKCEFIYAFSSYIDNNCENQQINEFEICNRCKIGYYFDISGECVKCQTNEFCLFCDSSKPDICLVCKFGSFMNTSKICHQYVFPVDQKIFKSSVLLMNFVYGLILLVFVN